MNGIKATYHNGQIIPHEPLDWPEGTEVLLQPVLPTTENGSDHPIILGMTEEEQGDDPESIARWLAEFDAIPALRMSAEEQADMESWRQQVKAFNIEAVRRQMEEGIE